MKRITRGKSSYPWIYYLDIFIIIIVCYTVKPAVGQILRTFPPLFNIAQDQPIKTTPAQSSCGIPTRSSYCQSSESPQSIAQCQQEFCVQECPRRTALPNSVVMLVSSRKKNACYTSDSVNKHPRSLETDASILFRDGTSCLFEPKNTPLLGANGAFTLIFWVWQEVDNIGTIIEKSNSENTAVFRIVISSSTISFVYNTVFGVQQLDFTETIPPNTWMHIALQVYDVRTSLFINGLSLGYMASGTQGMVGQVLDTTQGEFRIGQDSQGGNQFVGRLQDVLFFQETLTNREIEEIYSGSFPPVLISPSCRCPASHPRVKPLNTRFCIQNGVPDNVGDDILRLNEEAHPIEYATDGDSNSVWISSFLDEATLTIDLQDQFQVFYVVLQFYGPQPKSVVIERQMMDTETNALSWQTWQYYSHDCLAVFNMDNNAPITLPTTVNCLQFPDKVAYSNGNITFSILSSSPVARPGHKDFYNTPELYRFVSTGKVRVRLQDHYHVVQPRHMYYGIYELIVTGRCNCHGHADTCDTSTRPYTCDCFLASNTEGNQCDRCKPLYNDKSFHNGDQINAYDCKPCQCYGHAASCVYNQTIDEFPEDHTRGGGGVCVNCLHNTQERMCNECVDMYYRSVVKSLYAEDVCEPCDCSEAGINGTNFICEKVGGQCPCKNYADGRQCDGCKAGYYNLDPTNNEGCHDCMCDPHGTVGGDLSCHQVTGHCSCKPNVRNLRCDACQYGFYNLSDPNPSGCSPCLCNPLGSLDQFCNPLDGQCMCKDQITGRQCDVCTEGFYNFAAGCQQCDCDPQGSESGTLCDHITGQCTCKAYTTGLRCDQCVDGYFNLGADAVSGCLPCGCDQAGTMEEAGVCDKTTGECKCKANVQGRSCNLCNSDAFNLTVTSELGCESCGCDPSGTERGDLIPQGQLACDHNTGQCSCLPNRFGRRCEFCQSGNYITLELAGGCSPCNCYDAGTIRLTDCDSRTGQCQCYGGESGIMGRRCDTCKEFFYQLNPSTHSCSQCDCDPSGSVNNSCNANTGQCICKEFTTGRQCGQCVSGTSNLQADNPFGCSKAPSQQPPPSYKILNSTAFMLFWNPPDYPNGVIQVYHLYRDGLKIADVNATGDLAYNDTDLLPFTNYVYYIIAYNSYGSTRSTSITYRTPAGIPSGTLNLRVSNIQPRSAVFGWSRPASANGIIQKYVLRSGNHLDPNQTVTHYTGLAFNITVTGLMPHVNYTFQLEACTAGGCLLSDWVVVITGEALPEGQLPPAVTPLSSTELYIKWEAPQYPNGIIIFYELWIRGLPGSNPDDGVSRLPPSQRIFHPAGQFNRLPDAPPSELPPPETNFTAVDLDCYTQYEFQVISENALGKAASAWVMARTAPCVPQEAPLPTATAISSESVNLTWTEPSEKQARGVIQVYNVYHHQSTEGSNPFAPPKQWVLLSSVTPTMKFYLVSDLLPYRTETFVIELCNTVGCVNSTEVNGTTMAAAPTGLESPMITGYNASVMSINWVPPKQVNGPAPMYIVRSTNGSFNSPPPLVSKGTRFPGTGYYKFPSNTIPEGVAFTGFSLWFKTSQRDALIMFAASEGGQEEFVALQIRAGRPWFLFDPQDCTVFVTPNITDSRSSATDNNEDNNGDNNRDNNTFTYPTTNNDSIIYTTDMPETSMYTESSKTDFNATDNFSDGLWHHVVVTRQLHTAYITVDDKYTGCAIIVTTTDDEGLPYNDNKWHHLLATRQDRQGKVVMDGKWQGWKEADCNTVGNIIGANTGMYVGGLPEDYIIQRKDIDIRAQVIRSSFQGCLKDIKMLTATSPEDVWTDLDWSTVTERDGAMPEWEGCPDDLDVGYHFLGTGYTVYQSGIFVGGPVVDFQFYMRTERKSGMLFFAYGGVNVYYLIQVQNGGISVEFRNNDVKQSLMFDDTEAVNICDGDWHFIQVYKYHQSISITIDNIHSSSGGSRTVLAIMVIASDFYIGGIKSGSEAETFIKNTAGLQNIMEGNFGGCIRSIRINRRPYSLEQFTRESVNLNLDGCPAVHLGNPPCQASEVKVIYRGNGNSTLDFNMLPFTEGYTYEYMYQVEAVNEAGSTISHWSLGRTREGAPTGVAAPTSVDVISGFSLYVKWVEPEGRTGRLSQFGIKAYDLDRIEFEPIETWFNASDFEGFMNDTVPYTNYSVKLVACTKGGCTESEDDVQITTFEEAPRGVQPPVAIESGGSNIEVGWEMPTQPNGVITGYFLFMEGRAVYNGALLQYSAMNLNMYTGYRFIVQACSRVGCTNSTRVTLATAQLPPTHLNPPKLTVLGTHHIKVNWVEPDEINGVLERYIVYLSSNTSSLGDVIYNSTDLFLETIINELTPGTTYFISVEACTAGGCTTSDTSMATTEESAPEGIYNPVVVSTRWNRLKVTWKEPEFPNGKVSMYRVYHNELLIVNTTLGRQTNINNLQSYTLHFIRLEVCTAQGCASSDTVEAWTLESPPQGNIGVNVKVEGPREVSVQWNAVRVPNGKVLYSAIFEGLYYVSTEEWDYRTYTDKKTLYSTENITDQWVNIDGLLPFSTYYIQVNASNTKGFIMSNILQASMPMGAPDGVKAPVLTTPNASTVRARWEPVGRNNANQEPVFQLQFMQVYEGAQVQNLFEKPTTSNTFLKLDLHPFTEYRFRLVASNAYGQTTSEWATVITDQSRPNSIDPPLISNIGTRNLVVTWEQPYQPNGDITEFKLYQNGTVIKTLTGNETQTTVEDLIPFTSYVYVIETCTMAGCTSSSASNVVTTLKAYPEGIAVPTLLSQTPTSVLIVWTAPEFPNGVLLQYLIERRLEGDSSITLVKTFLPQDPKQYVDEDKLLTPHTVYEYRIGAYTEIGVGYSPWALITTKSSGPGGVFAPTVVLLNSTSMKVTWSTPLQPNGRLESYIIKLPSPRFEILNTSATSLIVSQLVPYTEYRVTLTACSDGGCTESIATIVRTSPALPDGIRPPVATAHSQTFISLVWQPPGRPNGPNIRYELARSKVMQPLIVNADGFGVWTSIYSGLNMYTEDRGLTMYTTYQYRLTVYNDFGHNNSEISSEVTTFGGIPTKAATVEAYSVNHTAIEVRWQNPTLSELQGGITHFILNMTGFSNSQTLTVEGSATSVLVTELEANTQYGALLTLVVLGGGSITSQPVYATTMDGAPEGLSPPTLFAINQTSLRITWTPPSKPNGDITTYYLYLDSARINVGGAETSTRIITGLQPYTIYIIQTSLRITWTPPSKPNGDITTYYLYLDSARINVGGAETSTRIITGLQPYTIYIIQLEACTQYACVKSSSVKATTAESLPSDIIAPQLSVLGSDSIEVTWQEPEHANGIILRYELYRNTQVLCTQPDLPDNTVNKCNYFECGVTESFCGDQCYSGPKTCCGGKVYDNTAGYECCGSSYIPRRTRSDDVCCGANFYEKLDDHQCCGNRYVPVPRGSICCTDPMQDRIVIDSGDACCNGIPYHSNNSSQICCNGELVGSYRQICCGGSVVSDSIQCCGGAELGTAYSMDSRNVCCGNDYTDRSLSVCCQDEIGNAKVHVYSSSTALMNSNEKCCDTDRVSAGLDCCNGAGYNPLLQVCADVSSMDTGCGSGTICVIEDHSSAFCDSCSFDRSTQNCGSYTSQVTGAEAVIIDNEEISTSLGGKLCISDPLKIYTGDLLSFTDSSLSPYTEYQYSMVVVNGAGSVTSPYSAVTTSQTLPTGVTAPVSRVEQGQLDTIYLSWEEPEEINGVILWYILLRDSVEIFRSPSHREHTDDNAIQPYRTYTYVLRVCNGAGCVESSEVKVATVQAKPSGVRPPDILAQSSMQLQITWAEPVEPNGFITRYELYRLGPNPGLVANVSGDAVKEYTATGLTAYGEYSFRVTACTAAGCTNSTTASAKTLQDIPTGVNKPILLVRNSTALEVYWSKPESVNGIIVSQKLFRSEENKQYTLQFIGGATDFSNIDTTVNPGMNYQYKIEISTEAGGLNSTTSSIIMPMLTPDSTIPAPFNVTVLSSTDIYVAWMPVNLTNTNHVIDQYKVLLNPGTLEAIERGVGTDTNDLIVGLKPYTDYEVRIQACISGVENSCGTGQGVTVRTLEALPTNFTAPVTQAIGSSSVFLTWTLPLYPNGVILQYRVFRRMKGQNTAGLLVNVVGGDVYEYINTGQDLSPFSEYEYSVLAVNSIGEVQTLWVSVRTLESQPELMSEATVLKTGSHSVTLSWQPPVRANGIILRFRIDYRKLSVDPTTQYPINDVVVLGSVLQTVISGLDPYTVYELRVGAVNSVGDSAGDWVQTKTQEASPSDLSSFDVEKLPDGMSVILRWNVPLKPNGVITNYLIYEQGNVNSIYQGLSREFEYRRLEPYIEYVLQLEACTIGGCTKSPLQKFFTAEVAPENQPSPTFGEITGTQVTLRWSKPLNTNGKLLSFEIIRRSAPRIKKRQTTDTNGDGTVIYRTIDTNANEYEFTDTSLQPYTKYEYKIRAVNSAGFIDSEWQSVETLQMAPTGVFSPVVSHVGMHYDQLSITWSAPTSPNGVIMSYQLQRNTSVPWSFAPNDEKLFIDTALNAFTYYAYTITVCTAGGCTKSTQSVRKTKEAPPLSVAPPVIETINSTALRATWAEPQITNGQIQEYKLSIDNVTQYSGVELIHTMNNLIPYKAYIFSLVACTYGGCTASETVIGRPDEASPTGLSPPMLRVTGSNSIEISWNVPNQPNGIITSYEVKRDGVLIQTSQNLQYVDFTVVPGSTYTYTVTAYNSKGIIESLPVSATTYPSAPVGLAAPILNPLSSTVIRAAWSPPLKPNGIIYNYTLYVDDEIVSSSSSFSKDVTGLNHYTEYSFRLEACTSHGCAFSDDVVTARTLEAPPTNLAPPTLEALDNSDGEHAGVEVHWLPPRMPNGIITRYEVYRRDATGLDNNIYTGINKLVYDMAVLPSTNPEEQLNMHYEDYDVALQPFSDYEYSVTAYNVEGHVRSLWVGVKTSHAPPQGVPLPVILSFTSTTITIEIQQPRQKNGVIERYQVAVNDSIEYNGPKNVVVLGDPIDTADLTLQPFTKYSIKIGMCTVGCTLGNAVVVTTGIAIPEGVNPPIAGTISSNLMNVVWTEPQKHNGPVTYYELHWRRTCPYPYADQDDEIDLPCTVGAWVSAVSGASHKGATLKFLSPYTTYELRLTVWNDAGEVQVTAFATTRPTAPQYNRAFPPVVTPINSVLVLDWGSSFHINAEVQRFKLLVNEEVEYSGMMTKHTIVRKSMHRTYELIVQLVTTYGEASTEKVTWDPSVDDVNYVSTAAPIFVEEQPFYQKIWFIVIIACVALIVIVIGLVFCFVKGRSASPYIRERPPLKTTPVFTIENSFDNSEMPKDEENPTNTEKKKSNKDQNQLYPGYVNPSYSSMSVTSTPASLADMQLDKMSSQQYMEERDYGDDRYYRRNGAVPRQHQGDPYDDRDYGDYNYRPSFHQPPHHHPHHSHRNADKWVDDYGDEDLDSMSDGFVPTDSGLHSLAYGEEYDSDRPMSVVREHQLFTDTHL